MSPPRLDLARKKTAADAALERAQYELGCALDAAGQVYMFGHGTDGQFKGAPCFSERSWWRDDVEYKESEEQKAKKQAKADQVAAEAKLSKRERKRLKKERKKKAKELKRVNKERAKEGLPPLTTLDGDEEDQGPLGPVQDLPKDQRCDLGRIVRTYKRRIRPAGTPDSDDESEGTTQAGSMTGSRPGTRGTGASRTSRTSSRASGSRASGSQAGSRPGSAGHVEALL